MICTKCRKLSNATIHGRRSMKELKNYTVLPATGLIFVFPFAIRHSSNGKMRQERVATQIKQVFFLLFFCFTKNKFFKGFVQWRLRDELIWDLGEFWSFRRFSLKKKISQGLVSILEFLKRRQKWKDMQEQNNFHVKFPLSSQLTTNLIQNLFFWNFLAIEGSSPLQNPTLHKNIQFFLHAPKKLWKIKLS